LKVRKRRAKQTFWRATRRVCLLFR